MFPVCGLFLFCASLVSLLLLQLNLKISLSNFQLIFQMTYKDGKKWNEFASVLSKWMWLKWNWIWESYLPVQLSLLPDIWIKLLLHCCLGEFTGRKIFTCYYFSSYWLQEQVPKNLEQLFLVHAYIISQIWTWSEISLQWIKWTEFIVFVDDVLFRSYFAIWYL